MDMKEFASYGADKEMKILEIGPSRNPMYKKSDGYQVDIVDYVDEVSLRNIYEGWPGVDNIEPVDFVCSRYYAQHIGRKNYYDIIAASHVIEVVVDLIGTLEDFSILLKEEGRVRLIVPDKRYEYDYFREVTSFREIIDAHVYNQGDNHTPGAVLDYHMNAVEAEGFGVYMPNSGTQYKELFRYPFDMDTDEGTIRRLKDEAAVWSAHKFSHIQSWVFTPVSFEILIYQLNVLGYTDLMVDKITKINDSLEFYVTLKKENAAFSRKHLQKLQIARRREELACFSHEEVRRHLEMCRNTMVLIYGAGKRAERIKMQLEQLGIDWHGYVVSDGHRKSADERKHERRIYELSELGGNKNVFVFLGTDEKYQPQICEKLEMHGIPYA